VALTAGARIDVSGDTGGGSALIGGSFRGQDRSMRHAQVTYVGLDASLAADATRAGHGGLRAPMAGSQREAGRRAGMEESSRLRGRRCTPVASR
jgi:hypothetical protein